MPAFAGAQADKAVEQGLHRHAVGLGHHFRVKLHAADKIFLRAAPLNALDDAGVCPRRDGEAGRQLFDALVVEGVDLRRGAENPRQKAALRQRDGMISAFAGATSMAAGYLGLIIGALMAGAVYVLIAILVRIFGTGWVGKLMPPVIIGPTVAIIGLSLAGSAITNLKSTFADGGENYAALLCGLIALAVTLLASTYGKGMPLSDLLTFAAAAVLIRGIYRELKKEEAQ